MDQEQSAHSASRIGPSQLSSPDPSASILNGTDGTRRARQLAERLIADQQYEQAIRLLNGEPADSETRNLKGVALMRMGAVAGAVQVYRGYVLHTGSVRVRRELDPTHIRNFATALLLSGRPAGCLEVLGELPDPAHPAAVRLRDAITVWARGLGWWNRLNWWLGRLEPDPCVVPLAGLPVEIRSCIPARATPELSGGDSGLSASAAVC